DLADDSERDRQRLAPRQSADRHGALALNRGDEALQLQAQRVALRGVDRHSLDELLDRLGALRIADERGEIHPRFEVIKLARSRAEIERQIPGRLKAA